jgi:hypothetical protein
VSVRPRAHGQRLKPLAAAFLNNDNKTVTFLGN